MNENVLTDERFAEGMLTEIEETGKEVISEKLDRIREILKNRQAGYFVNEAFGQWKYGRKLENPLCTFTKKLKRGDYNELPDREVDLAHDAAVSLSGLWRSEAEVDPEKFKSNIGYFLIQEIIVRMVESGLDKDEHTSEESPQKDQESPETEAETEDVSGEGWVEWDEEMTLTTEPDEPEDLYMIISEISEAEEEKKKWKEKERKEQEKKRKEQEKKDFEMVLKSALIGYPDSQYHLALCYEMGLGTRPNINKAIKWYRIAAAKGDEDAKARLKDLKC